MWEAVLAPETDYDKHEWTERALKEHDLTAADIGRRILIEALEKAFCLS